MLTAAQFDNLSTPITDLYNIYMDSVIQDIARRLANMSYASAGWQLQRLTESGKVYENAIRELAKITGKSEKELNKIFKDAGVKSLRFDDSIYRAAGLNPLPLNLSPAMLNVLRAGLEKTNGVMRNLTLTTANTAQAMFISQADLAYMQISTGTMSYQQAIRQAIKHIGDSGLEVLYPSGKRDKLDVAMRRTVLTGVAQTTDKIQESRADEMGTDLVQISAHIGARPSHAVWQGKIFSRSGNHPKYDSFVASTGYGTGAGLGGWNCRHSFYPFFEGISENAYKKATLNDYANKTVKYNDKELSVYDATQAQRAIERNIRKWKRQELATAASLKAAIDKDLIKELTKDNLTASAKTCEWQARMRDFVRQTKLDRQRMREQV